MGRVSRNMLLYNNLEFVAGGPISHPTIRLALTLFMSRCYKDVPAGWAVPGEVYVAGPELLCPFGVTHSILTS